MVFILSRIASVKRGWACCERCFLPRWEATIGSFPHSHGNAHANTWKCNHALTGSYKQEHVITYQMCVCWSKQLDILRKLKREFVCDLMMLAQIMISHNCEVQIISHLCATRTWLMRWRWKHQKAALKSCAPSHTSSEGILQIERERSKW